MSTENEMLKRECLEILVEQNPNLDKDSIIALFNNIENSSNENTPLNKIKLLIKEHRY